MKFVSATLIATVVLLPASAFAQRYSITYLGTLPNPPATTPNSRAYALNENGLIVGLSAVPGNSNAFVYRNGTFANAGTLGPNRFSELRSVNENGLAVGYGSREYGVGATVVDTAAYWTQATGMMPLPALSASGDVPRRAQATGVNDNGLIVGNANNLNNAASSVVRPVYWSSTSATAPNILTGLFGDAQGAATWVNNRGQIVGNSQFENTSTVRRAVRWDGTSATPTDISALASSLGFVDASGNPIVGRTIALNQTGVATAINENGSIIGSIRYANNGILEASSRAFLYDAPNNRFIDFGLTPNFNLSTSVLTLSVARGINDAGDVVGNFNNSDGDQAFLFEGGNLINLNTPGLIESTSLAQANFTVIRQAWGINNRGEIVGFASVTGGGVGAFVLTPLAQQAAPEPAALGFCLVGGIMGALARKRKV